MPAAPAPTIHTSACSSMQSGMPLASISISANHDRSAVRCSDVGVRSIFVSSRLEHHLSVTAGRRAVLTGASVAHAGNTPDKPRVGRLEHISAIPPSSLQAPFVTPTDSAPEPFEQRGCFRCHWDRPVWLWGGVQHRVTVAFSAGQTRRPAPSCSRQATISAIGTSTHQPRTNAHAAIPGGGQGRLNRWRERNECRHASEGGSRRRMSAGPSKNGESRLAR